MTSLIRLLTIKSCRMVWRSPSMRVLITVSASMVFVSLYLMWFMSYNQTLKFMTSNAYTKLSFDLICAPGTKYQPGISQCRPTGDNRPDGDVSPADILINLLTTGSILSDANDPNSAHDFAGLLSSIMMNGAPMLGLDDFVHLSDFVNKNLGSHGRGQIMNSTAYSDKFGNFLDVRRRELRITPYSCWTEQFLSHLNSNSLTAKDLNIIQYPSMKEAMKDCCDDVWAIVEITGPKEGFDCSLFLDTGGTRYRSSNPLYSSNVTDEMQSSGPGTRSGISEEAANPVDVAIDRETRSTIDETEIVKGSVADRGSIRGSEEGAPRSLLDEADFQSPEEESVLDVVQLRALTAYGPSVTVRMLPSAIPDTRNFEWSPRKSGSMRQQSGQLLYFLSGFLSIQLEVQNFLSTVGLGGPVIASKVFGDSPDMSFFRPNQITRNIAEALIKSSNPDEVFRGIINTTSEHRENRPALLTPLYHRAFPTHRYVQQTFWHVYGSMIATALIVYFSLPAAVTAGAFRREVAGGQLDSLSTLPGLRAVHSAAAWCVCGAFWSSLSFLLCYLFFLAVLNHTSAVVPAFSLFLCGLSLGPLAMALGCVIRRADALVVTVPTFVFITMLPGLLYVDLAFDVQRSVWLELFMCLLPPSGAALVLREVCGLEALGIAARWTYPAQISRTPIYAYAVVLFFDFILYSVLAAMAIEANHRTNTPVVSAVKSENSDDNTYSYNNNNNDHHDSSREHPTGDIDINTPPAPIHRAISLGLWTLHILGSAFSVILREASNILGYCWGRDVHTYASVQQHQQQQSNLESYNALTPRKVQGSKSLDELGTRQPRSSPRKSPRKSISSISGLSTPRFSPSGPSSPSSHSLSDWAPDSNGVEMEAIGLDRKNSENGNNVSKTAMNTANNRGGVRNNEEEEGEKKDGQREPNRGNRNTDTRNEENGGHLHQGPTQTCMRILDLSKEYGTDSTGVVILHRVCAELRQGTVTCLLGSNGAGKTTLMRIMCGLDSQYTGEVTLTADHPMDADSSSDSYDTHPAHPAHPAQGQAADRSREHTRPSHVIVENANNVGLQPSSSNPLSLTPPPESYPLSSRSSKRDQPSFFEIERNGDLELESGGRSDRLSRTITADASDVENAYSDAASLPHALSFFTVRWWRVLGVFFVMLIFRVFARVHRFLRRQREYFFAPPRRELRRCVGWCSQEDALFDYLTVREHVELFDDLLGGIHEMGTSLYAEDLPASTQEEEVVCDGLQAPKRLWKKIVDFFTVSRSKSTIRSAQAVLIARLGMEEHAEKYALELSGGMKRRLTLALAFAGSPKVLLLDEPSSGCDSWTRELVRKDILLRRDKTAILVSTHHIDDVEVLSDRVWFLNERFLAFNGSLDELTALKSSRGASRSAGGVGGGGAFDPTGVPSPFTPSPSGPSGRSGLSDIFPSMGTQRGSDSRNKNNSNRSGDRTGKDGYSLDEILSGQNRAYSIDTPTESHYRDTTESPDTRRSSRGTDDTDNTDDRNSGDGMFPAIDWTRRSSLNSDCSSASDSLPGFKSHRALPEEYDSPEEYPGEHPGDHLGDHLGDDSGEYSGTHFGESAEGAGGGGGEDAAAGGEGEEGAEYSPECSADSSMNLDLQFSTWSESVVRMFLREFSSENANRWLMESSLASQSTAPQPPPREIPEKVPGPRHENENENENENQPADPESESKNFYLWRVPAEYSPQLHRMLVLLEGERDVHWSVHSPNIYDALSAMYCPALETEGETEGEGEGQSASPPLGSYGSPHPLFPNPTSAADMGYAGHDRVVSDRSTDGGHGYTSIDTEDEIPPHEEEHSSRKKSHRRTYLELLSFLSILLHTVSRQCFYILNMRLIEVHTNFTQFAYTQIILPFLVVLGVVVGCRDVSYPKVELSSRNTDGIGEVCVGRGPGSAESRAHSPFSSPWEKVTTDQTVNDTKSLNAHSVGSGDHVGAENTQRNVLENVLENGLKNIPGDVPLSVDNMGVHSDARLFRAMLRLWERIIRFLFGEKRDDPNVQEGHQYGNASFTLNTNSSDLSRYRGESTNRTLNDLHAMQQYPGYKRLLTLLGRKTLRWSGVMNSDTMFQDLYEQYYSHKHNRWASFVIDDVLEEWLESTVVIEQGALNVSVSSAFDEILRAQKKLCYRNATAHNSSTHSAHSRSAVGLDGGDGVYHSTREGEGGEGVRGQYDNHSGYRGQRGLFSPLHSNSTGHWDSPLPIDTPRPPLTDPNPSYDPPSYDPPSDTHSDVQPDADITPHSEDHTTHASICGKHPAIRIYRRKGKGKESNSTATSSCNSTQSEDEIVIKSYEVMRSNVSMLSNVTTDHAAPVFLKEMAPAVYSSLLNYNQSQRGGSTDDTSGLMNMYQTASIPIYRLYSHPLPKINYTNEIYIERGYLGATMIVLYMLITTIVSVRAITQLRKNGVKLQLHIAGVHPITYWCCNFFADSSIVLLSLLSVFLAVAIGGEPIRDYFLNSSPLDFPGKIFLESIFAFSFAVVASSFAFSARSSDQLSSQLLMLISTVAGGVFLKLYLDRHSGPFFGLVSSVFTWFSPCFTFSTCMFDLFALRGAQMSMKFGAPVGAQVRTSIAAVYRCIYIMLFQIVFYMTITIVIDCYWARVQSAISHLRFLLSLPLKPKVSNKRRSHSISGVEMSDLKRRSRDHTDNTDRDNRDGRDGRDHSYSFDSAVSSAVTPLVQSAQRSYSSTFDSYDGYDESRPPILRTTHSVPLGPQSGQGTLRVLQANGRVYGEIGLFPSVDDLQMGLKQRQREEKDRREERERREHGDSDVEAGRGSMRERGFERSEEGNGEGGSWNGDIWGAERGRDDDDASSSGFHDSSHASERGVGDSEGEEKEDYNDGEEGEEGEDDIVTARDLYVEYAFGSKRKMALNGLTFDIKRGERVALLGMNGGGKSSLFKVLALAENVPVDGYLETAGKDVVTEQWAISVQEKMGYVAQDGGLLEFLTVKQTLELFHGIHSIKHSIKNKGREHHNGPDGPHGASGGHSGGQTRSTPWGELVGTSPKSILPSKYLNYYVNTLSGGNRKKLSVAISNINDPAFLAIDECTSGVDPVAAERIVRYLKDLRPSQGLLFASHRIDECISTCNRVLMLVEGSVYFDGSVHAFDQLASFFYQVDLVLPSSSSPGVSRHSSFLASERNTSTRPPPLPIPYPSTPYTSTSYPPPLEGSDVTVGTAPLPPTPAEEIISRISLLCGGRELFERVVEYSPTLIRLTFEKRLVPLTKVWSILGDLKQENVLEKYSFRTMGMEEALATIIASSKGL